MYVNTEICTKLKSAYVCYIIKRFNTTSMQRPYALPMCAKMMLLDISFLVASKLDIWWDKYVIKILYVNTTKIIQNFFFCHICTFYV